MVLSLNYQSFDLAATDQIQIRLCVPSCLLLPSSWHVSETEKPVTTAY